MSATRFAGSRALKIAGKPVKSRRQNGPPRALRAVAVVAMQLAAVQPLLTWPHLAMAQDCQTPNTTPTVTPQDAQEGTSWEAPPASYTTTDPDFTSSSVSTSSYVSQSSIGDYGDGGGSFSTTSGTDYNGTDYGGTTTVWTGGNIGGSNIDTGTLDSDSTPLMFAWPTRPTSRSTMRLWALPRCGLHAHITAALR